MPRSLKISIDVSEETPAATFSLISLLCFKRKKKSQDYSGSTFILDGVING